MSRTRENTVYAQNDNGTVHSLVKLSRATHVCEVCGETQKHVDVQEARWKLTDTCNDDKNVYEERM